MRCHLLCDDGLGRCMAIFVYLVMFVGNATYFLTVLNPKIGTLEETDALIEYLCYSVCWLLMLGSHVFTMCVDPGFIPFDYEYKEGILAAPFKTLSAVETAYMNKDKVGSDAASSSINNSRSRLSSVHDTSARVQGQKARRSSGGPNMDNEAVIPKLR
mmetsp:Transcript_3843/g.4453  ORF Transcript_3843/g.4453 Transcript_3843/m.4453 type:complete len:158 (+) Transcript_3843:50-523(+)